MNQKLQFKKSSLMNLIKLNDDLGHQRNKEAFRLRKVVVFF